VSNASARRTAAGSGAVARRVGVNGESVDRSIVKAAFLAAAAALLGAVLALDMVRTGRDAKALQADSAVALHGPAAVGEDVRTSFGVIAVESVTRSAGPTAKALAGATHGIQSLVPPDKVQVMTTVTLTNLRTTALAYSPAQFRLYATRGRRPAPGDRPIAVMRSSVGPGRLQPNASIDATLAYIAPRNGSKLWASFSDPGARAPILIDLGRTDRTPPRALAHAHH
jgi:hypothetical protein